MAVHSRRQDLHSVDLCRMLICGDRSLFENVFQLRLGMP